MLPSPSSARAPTSRSNVRRTGSKRGGVATGSRRYGQITIFVHSKWGDGMEAISKLVNKYMRDVGGMTTEMKMS